jgi:hypothetical protein
LSEDATAVARIIRAFAKFIHRVPVDTNLGPKEKQQQIDSYIQKATTLKIHDEVSGSVESRTAPMTVNTDFYLPDDGSGRGGVTMMDPENAQLQNVADLQYFLDRFITATRVPKRYFPFQGSVPKLSEGGGESEDKNFAAVLVFCQMMLTEGYASLFDRQLLLQGINPLLVRYVVRMPDINTTDQLRSAQTQMALAKTMQMMLQSYPEMRPYFAEMMREFARISDASMATMAKIELGERAPVDAGGTPAENDDRVSLPGAGNPEARGKV